MQKLHDYGLLPGTTKPDLDDIPLLATRLCGVAMAAISVEDKGIERFLSCHDCSPGPIPSRRGLAHHVIDTRAPLVVEDVRKDERFHDAPLLSALPDLRFYAGVPLLAPDGTALGTLCIMDRVPHAIGNDCQATLAILSEHVIRRLETRPISESDPDEFEEDTAETQENPRELERINEHLRFAQQVGNIGSWEYRVADGSRTWSDEVYRIIGLDRHAMPANADTLATFVHPDDRHMLEEARKRAISGAANPEFEHRIIRPDGEIRYVRERARLITDRNRKPIRLFGTIQDITDEKRTREKLLHNEHLTRIAGRMARLGAWQLDVPTQRVNWSEEVCEIHELEPCSSVPIDRAMEFIVPESRATVQHAIEACVNEGVPYDEEFEIVTAKGNRAHARAIGQAVYDQDGKVICVQGALQDITQQKQTEAAVKRLAEKLTNTLENISDAFITMDNDWHVTYMNKQAEQILQLDRKELLGERLWDRYPEEVGGVFHQQYVRSKNENRTVTFEEYWPMANAWLDVSAYPSADGLAVYFRDVSARKQAEAARRESEERTRLIIETAMDASISINRDSVITGWNAQAESTFGWSKEEALGQYLYDLIIPEQYRDAHRRGIAHFMETGDGPLLNRRVEITARNREGKEFPVELSVSPIKTGKTYAFSAFIRDITERKASESAIRESEKRFRVVAKATTDTVWDWDIATDAIWWNDGIRTVFGYEPDEVEPDSSSWTGRIHPEDRDRVVSGIRRTISGDEGDEWRDEYRFRRSDGSYAHVIDKGFVVRDAWGEVVRMIGGMNDITERKEYEIKIAEQAALLDKAQDAIIVRDVDNRITYWNKGAERLYGWSAEEAIGRFMDDLLHPTSERFRAATRQVLEKREWSGEIVKTHKDGTPITVEGAWTLVTDENDQPKCILTIDTNISARVALEEQLRQSQRLEAIGQLTGGVAHDFNNLLTVIMGNSELLEDQLPRGERLHKLAEMTRKAARRGADLTHRLLAFARRQALEPRGTDVDELLVGMEGLLRRTLLENVSLEIVRSDTLRRAYVDPSQLEAVILNLCINAKDAMPEGGRLTIEASNAQLDEEYAAQHAEVSPGRYVMIAVSDTGTGIEAENIGRVFDPFFTTKETGKGTGLGLSMAYGFAKQSRGHIKIYSEVGQGTTVKVYLPVAEGVDAAEEAPAPDLGNFSGTERILVVEDDDLVRKHAENQLSDFGYDVLTARNGPEALEIVKKQEDIDLLFTDVIMSGGLNGRELVKMARRIRPRLKVLYTSGYTENAILHHGRLDQGVNLLQKPYQRVDLAKKVRAALNDSRKREPGGAR